jgi:hypothetical protein
MLVGILLFVPAFWLLASLSAYLLYKLRRGYEENPPLAGLALWLRSALAGAVAVVIIASLSGVGFAAAWIVGPSARVTVVVPLLLVELLVWSVFCVWLCELENLLEGVVYAVVWMILLRALAFLILLPFGFGIETVRFLGL